MKQIVKNIFQIEKEKGFYGCVTLIPYIFTQENDKNRIIYPCAYDSENVRSLFNKGFDIYKFSNNDELSAWIFEELKKFDNRKEKSNATQGEQAP